MYIEKMREVYKATNERKGSNYNKIYNALNHENKQKLNVSEEKLCVNNDNIYISENAKNRHLTNGIGVNIDKGIAANTTMIVDKSLFNKIMNYSSNNSDCKWEEIGFDSNKRWIIINGQRFECQLSKEEKEAMEKRNKTLIDIIIEAESSYDLVNEEQLDKKINLSLEASEHIDVGSDLNKNEKIKNLMKNDKVITMLEKIMKTSGPITLKF